MVAVPVSAKAPVGRYTVDAANGTVHDDATKLTWQRDGKASGFKNHADAKTYCSGLSLNGSGWRLPHLRELESLVDREHSNPSIDPTAFLNSQSTQYWSSTLQIGTTSQAWFVSFGMGNSEYWGVLMTSRVRCVRGP